MDLRSKMLTGSKRKEEEIEIEIGNDKMKITIKEASLNERDMILQDCQSVDEKGNVKINSSLLMVGYVINCTYSDDKRVFEKEDTKELLSLPESTKWIDDIYNTIKAINNVDEDEIKKGLDKTPKSS